MNTVPTTHQIAESLIADNEDYVVRLEGWFREQYPEAAGPFSASMADTSLEAELLAKYFLQTAEDRVPLSFHEALTALESLNGISLMPFVDGLAQSMAAQISKAHLQDPPSEPLRREVEGGLDPEAYELFTALIGRSLSGKLAARVKAMTPKQALALAAGVYFWWGQRDLLVEAEGIRKNPAVSNMQHFFRLSAS